MSMWVEGVVSLYVLNVHYIDFTWTLLPQILNLSSIIVFVTERRRELTMSLSARRSIEDDAGHIKSLVGADTETFHTRYGDYKLGSLIETSYLAVTILEQTGKVVGFAAFTDSPPITGGYTKEWYSWVDRYPSSVQFQPVNCIWLSFYAADPMFDHDAILLALMTAFETIPHADYALYQLSKDCAPFLPVREVFHYENADPKKTNAQLGGQLHVRKSQLLYSKHTFPYSDCNTLYHLILLLFIQGDELCVAERKTFVNTLITRTAKVEDHDDLAPLFKEQSEVLTEDYGEFFLAEVISSQVIMPLWFLFV